VLDATGSFPEEASVMVSLAQHADILRHALPASQKIWHLDEGDAGLPVAPASLRHRWSESVMSCCCCVITAIIGEKP